MNRRSFLHVTTSAFVADSVVTNAYSLPRGHYRTLVKFGEAPDKLDENGVWLANFSIQ